MGSITLLVGGARSGKSSLAVRIGRAHASRGHTGDVTLVATAEPFDEEMAARIRAHRAERPPWPTIEAPVELAAAIRNAPDDHLLIVDCLTTWVATLMHHGLDVDATPLCEALAQRSGPAVVISNEVGAGIVPIDAESRRYRDLLGRLNQAVAEVAEVALLMVAGRAIPLQRVDDLAIPALRSEPDPTTTPTSAPPLAPTSRSS